MQVIHRPRADGIATHDFFDQRDQIAVIDFFLFVGQRFESLEQLAHVAVGNGQAHIFQTFRQGCATRMFTQHQVGGRHAHRRWRHDLITLGVFQHAVLMNATFVGKRVIADHGFVALNGQAGDRLHQAARAVQM